MNQRDSSFTPDNIPVFFLFHIEKYVDMKNGNTQRLWKNAGLVKENISPLEDSITDNQLNAFIDEAQAQFKNSPIGIELGEYISLGSFGLISRALMSCTNFKKASYIVARYVQFTLPLLQFNHTDKGDHFELEIFGTSRYPLLNHIIIEAIFANLLSTFKLLTGKELFFERADFCFPEPTHSEYFRSKVKACNFLNARTILCIKNELVEMPFITASEADNELILLQCEAELVKSQSEKSLSEQVIDQIKIHIETNPSATKIAERLHVSPRSLRRQLSDEGTSYRELVQSARTDMAKYLLTQTSLTISQIALRLGYQEASNFRTAFKNWTEHSPSAWRLSK